MTATTPRFAFDNSYARALEGFYVACTASPAPVPRLCYLNRPLAAELGLDAEVLDSETGAMIFSGNQIPDGASPLAQAYAGHQFGGFSPQLGDGRALLLGEVLDCAGLRRDIQLKGSGRTPFSRGGDGKAALGPVLREVLFGEAMHALGIPTTRALAAVTTGDHVYRDTALPGAVLARVAASHIRVGTFQFFAAQGDTPKVRQLADYTIARHYPGLEGRYLDFFSAVQDRQARLIAQWMNVGFIHGVMNTDNMAISGETIDYGPCAFVDAYDPLTVYSSIDRDGRYAFGNQPAIAQWNLARFAETLLDLVSADRDEAIRLLTDELGRFPELFKLHWLAGMRRKLGLGTKESGDIDLANRLLAVMQAARSDFTLTFRRLGEAADGDDAAVLELLGGTEDARDWLAAWHRRIAGEPTLGPVRAAMDMANPAYIVRNHKVEEALAAAVTEGDDRLFQALLALVSKPFAERSGYADYEGPAPENFGPHVTYCGT